MTAELPRVLSEHHKWIRGSGGECASLARADLSGMDLRGVDLSRADLARANLSRADLSRANLREAKLYGVDLTRADLSLSDLTRADLTRADLTRARLAHACLYDADLSFADLRRADLSSVDLSAARLVNVDLRGARIDCYARTYFGCLLELLGGEREFVNWVDDAESLHDDPDALLLQLKWPSWKTWLDGRLGGAPSAARLLHVADLYLTG